MVVLIHTQRFDPTADHEPPAVAERGGYGQAQWEFCGIETEHVERQTGIPGNLLDDPSFAFFAALLIPAQRLGYIPHDQPGQFWLLGTDGSWARQTSNANGQFVARQHGPRMLWDALEQAHHDWTSLGSPPRQHFGLTVTATGTHTLWCAQTPKRSWELH